MISKGDDILPNDKIIFCPFFRRLARAEQKQVTISCQNLCENIGFDMITQFRFKNLQERKDYIELFCSDRYKNCPYYEALVQRRECDKND